MELGQGAAAGQLAGAMAQVKQLQGQLGLMNAEKDWALKQVREYERYVAHMETELRNAASQGQLTVLGSPRQAAKGSGVYLGPFEYRRVRSRSTPPLNGFVQKLRGDGNVDVTYYGSGGPVSQRNVSSADVLMGAELLEVEARELVDAKERQAKFATEKAEQEKVAQARAAQQKAADEAAQAQDQVEVRVPLDELLHGHKKGKKRKHKRKPHALKIRAQI